MRNGQLSVGMSFDLLFVMYISGWMHCCTTLLTPIP